MKRDSYTGVSCGYCKILKTSFLYRTPPVAASDSPTIKSAGVTVYWFVASTCFWFWSKTHAKRCTNNSLALCDEIASSLLELIDHVLSVSGYVLERP